MRSRFKNNKKKFILMPFGIAALLAIISYVVMLLWNNLLPQILHVAPITFWQAMGIFILCKLLFGFGRGGGGAPWGRHRMEERFKGMTPEEKEEFKEKMKHRLCGWKRNHSENS